MSPEKRSAIAANGGRALRPDMRAFSKNRELAAAAGRKGGAARKPRVVSVKGDADV